MRKPIDTFKQNIYASFLWSQHSNNFNTFETNSSYSKIDTTRHKNHKETRLMMNLNKKKSSEPVLTRSLRLNIFIAKVITFRVRSNILTCKVIQRNLCTNCSSNLQKNEPWKTWLSMARNTFNLTGRSLSKNERHFCVDGGKSPKITHIYPINCPFISVMNVIRTVATKWLQGSEYGGCVFTIGRLHLTHPTHHNNSSIVVGQKGK